KFLIKWVYVILLVSAIIQVYEVTLGGWLAPLGKAKVLEEFQGRSIEISGREVAYIWNRAVTYSYLGLFLALGTWITGNPQGLSSRKQILLISSGVVAFILTMVRSWYIMIVVGIIVILLFGYRRKKKLFSIILIGIILLVLFNTFWSFGIDNEVDILNRLTSRFSTILDVFNGKTLHFTTRMLLLEQQLEFFLKRPIFGYGYSKSISLYSSDIGLGNTLLRFGLVGLAWILLLLYSFYSNTKYLLKKLPQSLEKGYILGMVGAWTGMVIGYSFSWDFFTSKEGIFLVTLMLAFVDRINILFNKNINHSI
ncbi:MAG: O-antigen ligase family protein, partial [Candidatus Hodarchaeota archaeon]